MNDFHCIQRFCQTCILFSVKVKCCNWLLAEAISKLLTGQKGWERSSDGQILSQNHPGWRLRHELDNVAILGLHWTISFIAVADSSYNQEGVFKLDWRGKSNFGWEVCNISGTWKHKKLWAQATLVHLFTHDLKLMHAWSIVGHGGGGLVYFLVFYNVRIKQIHFCVEALDFSLL